MLGLFNQSKSSVSSTQINPFLLIEKSYVSIAINSKTPQDSFLLLTKGLRKFADETFCLLWKIVYYCFIHLNLFETAR